MNKLAAAVLVAMALSSAASFLYAQEKTKDEVIAIATESVKGQNFELKDVDIIYDEGGKL